MKTTCLAAIAVAVLSVSLAAQEKKPVPKDSVRVSVPGCTRGYIFTAAPRTEQHPGDMPEGTHLRMNGPKQMMAEIKAHEGSMIEITGLMKKGQFNPNGIGLGGGVRMMPGPAPGGAGMPGSPAGGQIFIDLESWRPIVGTCPSR